MKIPETYRVDVNRNPLIEVWEKAAIQVGLESGIYVTIEYDYSYYPHIGRIYFKALDREFEDLTTLKRVLKLKALL